VDVLQLWVQQTTWRYFDGDIMGIFWWMIWDDFFTIEKSPNAIPVSSH
jgi:hypothetical protein